MAHWLKICPEPRRHPPNPPIRSSIRLLRPGLADLSGPFQPPIPSELAGHTSCSWETMRTCKFFGIGISRVSSRRSSVDFPFPLGPTSPYRRPAAGGGDGWPRRFRERDRTGSGIWRDALVGGSHASPLPSNADPPACRIKTPHPFSFQEKVPISSPPLRGAGTGATFLEIPKGYVGIPGVVSDRGGVLLLENH